MNPEMASQFQDFIMRVSRRLDRGQQTYGARPSPDPQRLVSELEEEILDICGWSFILWVRLGPLRRAVADLERAAMGG